STAQPDRIKQLVEICVINYPYALIVLLIGVVSSLLSSGITKAKRRLLFILSVFGVGIFLAAFNVKSYEIPLVPVAALMALSLFLLWRVKTARFLMCGVVLNSLVALLFLPPIIRDVGALVRAEFSSSARGSELGWLRDTRISDLAVSEQRNGLLSNASGQD